MSQTATQTVQPPTLSPVIPALIAQISLTVALLLFIRDLWMLAPLDSTLMTAGGSGAALYILLMGGYAVVQRAMLRAPSKPEEPSTADAPASESGAVPPTSPGSVGPLTQPAPAREPVARASEPAALPAPPIPA